MQLDRVILFSLLSAFVPVESCMRTNNPDNVVNPAGTQCAKTNPNDAQIFFDSTIMADDIAVLERATLPHEKCTCNGGTFYNIEATTDPNAKNFGYIGDGVKVKCPGKGICVCESEAKCYESTGELELIVTRYCAPGDTNCHPLVQISTESSTIGLQPTEGGPLHTILDQVTDQGSVLKNFDVDGAFIKAESIKCGACPVQKPKSCSKATPF